MNFPNVNPDALLPVITLLLGAYLTDRHAYRRMNAEWNLKKDERRREYQREQLHAVQDTADELQLMITNHWGQVQFSALEMQSKGTDVDQVRMNVILGSVVSVGKGERNTLVKLRSRLIDPVVIEELDKLLSLDTSCGFEVPELIETTDPPFYFSGHVTTDSEELTRIISKLNMRIGLILANA